MALPKQSANFNFSQGMDNKTDPFQLAFGKLLLLKNCVFKQAKLLSKRNGYQKLTELPDLSSSFLSTFNNDLLAIGTVLQSYSEGTKSWTTRGGLIPIRLSVQSMVRTSTSQIQCDSVTHSNGVSCIVFTDQNPSSLSAVIYKYCLADSLSGNYITSPTQISTADPSFGTPRVFVIGSYFVILFTTLVTAVYHLKYIAIPVSSPHTATTPVDIANSYTPWSTLAFDGAIYNNNLYIAYNDDSAAGMKIIYLTHTLQLSSTFVVDATHEATMVSVTADPVWDYIWVSYFDIATQDAWVTCLDPALNIVLVPTQIINNIAVLNLASLARNGLVVVYYEVDNSYGFGTPLKTNYVSSLGVNTSGSVSSATVVARSVGLASKIFLLNDTSYFIGVYQSAFQSTYFLIDSSGNVAAKFAYQNAAGYLSYGLPNVTVQNKIALIAYLFKFSLSSINKGTGAGIYGQVGINQIAFNVDTEASVSTSEIGKNLNICGGFLWSFDGDIPVEQNFHLWPDLDVTIASNKSKCMSITTTGGSIANGQDYNYIATYEWQDKQGNTFRSGISLIAYVLSAALSTNTNILTVNVPTLRLTYKLTNPPKIVLYRWSTNQPTFFQVTSVPLPSLNNPAVDSIAIPDSQADASISGNTILYTTGGVLENTGGQAFDSVSIFDNRLFGILSETPDTLAFSQPIVDQTPVEMSLSLTKYISPVVGTEKQTGPNTCFGILDDKLIIFKENGINYINGIGPNLTGANGQYSEPVFITNALGCTNENSIIFIPQGLMFQSASNGIWLLGRDLSTKYIGADVEGYNDATVLDANAIPGTTYVVFTLDSGISLMYDYYFSQWGTFEGVPGIAATLYNNLHTYLDQYGRVFQETEGVYRDGGDPVLMGLTTGWFNLAGLQGYQRAYRIFLLASYKSPHKLQMGISYDYNPSVIQALTMTPTNEFNTYGSGATYGSDSPYGGTSSLEQFRINFMKQKCQSFQFSLQENYDPSEGARAGAGFTLSGLDIVFGFKKGYPRLSAAQTVG